VVGAFMFDELGGAPAAGAAAGLAAAFCATPAGAGAAGCGVWPANSSARGIVGSANPDLVMDASSDESPLLVTSAVGPAAAAPGSPLSVGAASVDVTTGPIRTHPVPSP
jgi:hypothetical protein